MLRLPGCTAIQIDQEVSCPYGSFWGLMKMGGLPMKSVLPLVDRFMQRFPMIEGWL